MNGGARLASLTNLSMTGCRAHTTVFRWVDMPGAKRRSSLMGEMRVVLTTDPRPLIGYKLSSTSAERVMRIARAPLC